MRLSLPSHPAKVLAATALAVVVILATAITTVGSSRDANSSENKPSLEAAANGSSLAQETPDSDNDGLPDWEEAVRKTNPNNPDTDGDGTKDGEEVDQNRDPLKAGPNDHSTSTRIPKIKDTYVPQTELNSKTLTSKSALSLFQAFVKGGGSTNPQLATQIGDAVSSAAAPKTYSSRDVIIVDTTRDNRVTYANAMTNIIAELQTNRRGASSAQNNTGLEVDIKAHQTMIARLKKTPVPQEALNIHLELMNSASDMIGLMNALQEVEEDPLYSVIVMSSNQDAIDGYGTALERVDQYIGSVSASL